MTISRSAREIASIARRHRLNYATFNVACSQARKALHLKPLSSGNHLPKLLPGTVLRRFYEAVDKTDVLQHRILFRLLIFTGLRVSELVNVRISDIDLDQGKIFVDRGKGDKDRYVLFRDDFRLTLKAYIESLRGGHEYLFESTQKRPYSPERIRQLTREYAVAAGITERVHPHAFRHVALTQLAKEGMTDAQIQLVSGHSSRDSLAIYTHLALTDVAAPYQSAMRKLEGNI